MEYFFFQSFFQVSGSGAQWIKNFKKKKILSPEAWGSEDFFPKNSKSRGQRAAGK